MSIASNTADFLEFEQRITQLYADLPPTIEYLTLTIVENASEWQNVSPDVVPMYYHLATFAGRLLDARANQHISSEQFHKRLKQFEQEILIKPQIFSDPDIQAVLAALPSAEEILACGILHYVADRSVRVAGTISQDTLFLERIRIVSEELPALSRMMWQANAQHLYTSIEEEDLIANGFLLKNIEARLSEDWQINAESISLFAASMISAGLNAYQTDCRNLIKRKTDRIRRQFSDYHLLEECLVNLDRFGQHLDLVSDLFERYDAQTQKSLITVAVRQAAAAYGFGTDSLRDCILYNQKHPNNKPIALSKLLSGYGADFLACASEIYSSIKIFPDLSKNTKGSSPQSEVPFLQRSKEFKNHTIFDNLFEPLADEVTPQPPLTSIVQKPLNSAPI